ncbi:DUF167 domain-containing protein [Thiolapillus sp.]
MSWYRRDGDDLLLFLKIQPRSGKDGFGEIMEGTRKLRIKGCSKPPNRLLKNAVFRQPVCGIGIYRHFLCLQAIENEGIWKSHFPDLLS